MLPFIVLEQFLADGAGNISFWLTFFLRRKCCKMATWYLYLLAKKAGFIEDTEYMEFFGKSAATAAGADGWKIGIYWQSRYNVI
nr:hypothetical protein [uncultured Janthinobacterium sp.]